MIRGRINGSRVFASTKRKIFYIIARLCVSREIAWYPEKKKKNGFELWVRREKIKAHE